MGKKILIVDDDELMRSFVTDILVEGSYSVEEASTAAKALAKFMATDFDLVITDLKLPDMSGLELLEKAKKINPYVKWIIITAYGSIKNAVDAMKFGASDYLTKPFKSPDELRHVVSRVLKEAEAEQKISFLSEELDKQFPPMDIIFLGEKMKEVQKLVFNVAPTPATVLIEGPSGTGKELVARVIHQLSLRKEKPFVAVNCAALVESLLESELFGHEKGAFTGAITLKKGKFEIANGGTLFLDELCEMPLTVQAKLLRVLQERSFERVGGAKSISVDLRIISATNRDIKKEVLSGRFREDLYYRLNVFPIKLPSLKERRDAIIPLADYFVKKFSAALGKRIKGLTEDAKSTIIDYEWPGNVRELHNIIERAVILADREFIDSSELTIETDSLSIAISSSDGLLEASEKETIRKVLLDVGGNRKKAAEILGISLRTLYYKIKQYEL